MVTEEDKNLLSGLSGYLSSHICPRGPHSQLRQWDGPCSQAKPFSTLQPHGHLSPQTKGVWEADPRAVHGPQQVLIPGLPHWVLTFRKAVTFLTPVLTVEATREICSDEGTNESQSLCDLRRHRPVVPGEPATQGAVPGMARGREARLPSRRQPHCPLGRGPCTGRDGRMCLLPPEMGEACSKLLLRRFVL